MNFVKQNNGIIKSGELALVVSSNPDAYALYRASQADIKAVTVDRKKYSQPEFEQRIIKHLEDEEIDLIVLAGFMYVLSAEFIRKYPDKIINVHPALIPSFCGDGFYGLRVHRAALEYGVKVTGATVHFVNEVTDGGKIILQKAVDVLEGDTPEILQKRVMEQAEWKLLPMAIEMICKE